MNELPWMILDALQAGALLALAVSFGSDALSRRDRMVGMVALACLLMCLRHGMMALVVGGVLEAALVDRMQSVLASLAFVAMFDAMRVVFPEDFPPRTSAWLLLLMLPSFLKAAFLPTSSFLYVGIRWWTMGVYVVASLLAISAVFQARAAGRPMGTRLLGGFILASLPLMVEVLALAIFGFKLRVAGLAIVLLAISIGTSWQWLIAQALQDRINRAEEECAAWRGLLGKPTWHTREISPFMDGLFGNDWERRLQDRMLGTDGMYYGIHRTALHGGGEVGWVETHSDTLPGTQTFLQGWTVALGFDEAEELESACEWLESWGASVQVWGTVPPREGPYPSILIWGREPSILAVWREDELARRRPRWIQLGGARVEGPHERLDRPLDATLLRQSLQRLISFGG